MQALDLQRRNRYHTSSIRMTDYIADLVDTFTHGASYGEDVIYSPLLPENLSKKIQGLYPGSEEKVLSLYQNTTVRKRRGLQFHIHLSVLSFPFRYKLLSNF